VTAALERTDHVGYTVSNLVRDLDGITIELVQLPEGGVKL
jgi:hypothetical protein